MKTVFDGCAWDSKQEQGIMLRNNWFKDGQICEGFWIYSRHSFQASI